MFMRERAREREEKRKFKVEIYTSIQREWYRSAGCIHSACEKANASPLEARGNSHHRLSRNMHNISVLLEE